MTSTRCACWQNRHCKSDSLSEEGICPDVKVKTSKWSLSRLNRANHSNLITLLCAQHEHYMINHLRYCFQGHFHHSPCRAYSSIKTWDFWVQASDLIRKLHRQFCFTRELAMPCTHPCAYSVPGFWTDSELDRPRLQLTSSLKTKKKKDSKYSN